MILYLRRVPVLLGSVSISARLLSRVRASILLAVTLVVLSASLPASRAGCCLGDPSAVDLDPNVEPLRIIHDDQTDELVLTWESVDTDYRVWMGDLDGLFATRELNDQVIEHVSSAEARIPTPGGNSYFVVSSGCFALRCTRGRDSSGVERATPGCEILEHGRMGSNAVPCLGLGSGVVRTSAEYDAFASCLSPVPAPDPPEPDEALVWATDFSVAACGSCLEFTCAARVGDELIVEKAGAPWGICFAVYNGGVWARVPDAPTIVILEEMPPIPVYGPCP